MIWVLLLFSTSDISFLELSLSRTLSYMGFYRVLTSGDRKEVALAPAEELPVEVVLQSKPPNDVVKEREGGHWVHLPFECGEHQKLHSLYHLCLKHTLCSPHLTN